MNINIQYIICNLNIKPTELYENLKKEEKKQYIHLLWQRASRRGFGGVVLHPEAQHPHLPHGHHQQDRGGQRNHLGFKRCGSKEGW